MTTRCGSSKSKGIDTDPSKTKGKAYISPDGEPYDDSSIPAVSPEPLRAQALAHSQGGC